MGGTEIHSDWRSACGIVIDLLLSLVGFPLLLRYQRLAFTFHGEFLERSSKRRQVTLVSRGCLQNSPAMQAPLGIRGSPGSIT